MRIMRISSVEGEEPVPRCSRRLMRDSRLLTTSFSDLSSSSTIPMLAIGTRRDQLNVPELYG